MQYEVPTTVTAALTIGVVTLAAVVVVLFKLYVGRNERTETALATKDKEIADERKQFALRETDWEAERERIASDAETEIERVRADADKRARETADSYAAELTEITDKFLTREDAIRKDFADRIERIASEASRASLAQNEVLNKIYERFVGPRRGSGRVGG